jgi:hypothetical protein
MTMSSDPIVAHTLALPLVVGASTMTDGIPDKKWLTIGDDVCLNSNAHVQCHSQEDFAFKSDRIAIGSRVILGVCALVHYNEGYSGD